METCQRGHFFNAASTAVCPYCPADRRGADVVSGAGASHVVAHARHSGETSTSTGSRTAVPVTGWLVAISGPDCGRDFRLHAGPNRIGRATNLEVCIATDPSITSRTHAVLEYLPETTSFVLRAADGEVYLNDHPVPAGGASEMTPRDRIQVGRTTLMFVPLCDATFRW